MIHRFSTREITGTLALGLLLTMICGRAAAAQSFPEVSQLPSHPGLPDPLVMFNGERVTTRQQWVDQRRPELKALFEHYMYGHRPPGNATFARTASDRNLFG